MKKINKKLKKEEPEFLAQKQYESAFKKDFFETLLLMNKTILQSITTPQENVIKE